MRESCVRVSVARTTQTWTYTPPLPWEITHTPLQGQQEHPDLTPWSLCFTLMLLSQPMRTADAGLPGTKASEQRVTQLLSTSSLHWIPRRRVSNINNSKDYRSASKTKTSTASWLAGRHLRNTSRTHTCTNQQVNKWHPDTPTHFPGIGGNYLPYWAVSQASSFFGTCHPLPTWGCPLCWLYSCDSNGAVCPHKQPPLQNVK